MSPTIAGLRTLVATAQPVRKREKMRRSMLWLNTEIKIPTTKRAFAALYVGHRPNISDNGAMNKGPAASPSSHMVTSRTLADLSL